MALEPCLMDDQSLELSELRLMIQEYDELFELCMTHQMSPDDQRELNDLHDALSLKEYEYWEDTPESIIAIVNEHFPREFPLIRGALGILPDEDELK